jgi:hypothetical protein
VDAGSYRAVANLISAMLATNTMTKDLTLIGQFGFFGCDF